MLFQSEVNIVVDSPLFPRHRNLVKFLSFSVCCDLQPAGTHFAIGPIVVEHRHTNKLQTM